jgi:hypothetical protein
VSLFKSQKVYPESILLKDLKRRYDINHQGFLDLTNNNLSYYFVKSSPPLKSIAMYNAVDDSQWIKAAQEKEKLKIILLRDENLINFHDNIYVSNRSPAFAKMLISDCHFKLLREKTLLYLVRQNECIDNSMAKSKLINNNI